MTSRNNQPPTKSALANGSASWKPYPAYKDSGMEWLGKVPGHWEVKELKYACKMITDGSHYSPPARDAGYYYVTVRNISNGEVDLSDASKISEEDFERLEKTNCRPKIGDVLFSKDGTVGKVALVKRDDFVILSSLAILRPSNNIDSIYLKYFIESQPGAEQIESYYAGAALKRVTLDIIVNLLTVVPPLSEQRTIAAFLDRETAKIDALITKKQRLIELLQEKRTALISQAVTKGLDPNVPMKDSGIEWLGEIPKHWEVRRLKYVGRAFIGLTYDPSDVVDESNGILVLRASNIKNGHFSNEDNVFVNCDIPDQLITKANDILICARSGSRSLIGKNIKLDNNLIGVTFGAFMLVFRSQYNDFLSYVLNSNIFEYQSSLFLTSTINQLTKNDLYSFQIPLPSPEEQRNIVRYLDEKTTEIGSLIIKVHAAVLRLQEYRIALISAAVTGKIDMNNNEP